MWDLICEANLSPHGLNFRNLSMGLNSYKYCIFFSPVFNDKYSILFLKHALSNALFCRQKFDVFRFARVSFFGVGYWEICTFSRATTLNTTHF